MSSTGTDLGAGRSLARAALAVAGLVLVAGGCAPAHQGTTTAAARPSPTHASPAAAYLAIATTGNRRLDADFDHLEDRDHANPPTARADLRDIAATERAFDQQLARLALPSAVEASARTLIRVNETRADLTARAAASTSLGQLHAAQAALTAANAPVERAVAAIRAELGLPPPDTS
ncbi:hypothetical protein [Streptacidiphilus melanogenes]|uniref:hypothetical protein n=1 Tax=Streptacidiphilus melanogenes TaxID=411235 RepID=UPI0005A89394|nr:hypothetical protein [Streptacidiphilus melanogenes]